MIKNNLLIKGNDFLKLSNFKNITISDSNILNLITNAYIVHVLESEEFHIDNLVFLMINSYDLRNSNSQKFGGCIRTFNILYREINGLITESSYSDLTTVGIIIIDNFFDITIHFKVKEFIHNFVNHYIDNNKKNLL